MKNALIASAVAFAAAAMAGCSSTSKDVPAGSAALTDVTPSQSVTPAPAPSPVAPVFYEPAPAAATPSPAFANGAAAGGKYTVKKGDTLWSIAKTSYGDGKQYTKIVSANPGVSPSSLKVGQTIMIP